MGGLDEWCGIPPSMEVPLDGPNLQLTGYVLEEALVSQDTIEFSGLLLRGLQDVLSPGLKKYQDYAKLADLRN